MIVTSLEEMEQIVDSNAALFWDGWTVVHMRPNHNGYSSKNGVYRDGKWHIQNRFEVTEQGWNLPNKFVR